MPIVTEIFGEGAEYHLGVWEITESEEFLSSSVALRAEESSRLSTMTNPSRRKEFLATRVLLNALSPNERIEYEVTGRPRLSSGRYISISHSQKRVAVLLSTRCEVAVDIEKFRSNISAIASKFVSESDRHAWGYPLTDEDLHVIWGAKEVLFKLHSLGDVDFRQHLVVSPLRSSKEPAVRGCFSKSERTFEADIFFRSEDGFVLTWSAMAPGF